MLKAPQADFGLPVTGVVDAAAVKAINAGLAKRATDPRTVRGRVSSADGNPARGLFVQGLSSGPCWRALPKKSVLRLIYYGFHALGLAALLSILTFLGKALLARRRSGKSSQ